jgi:polar amino acid transport system substrate-binding protein
MNAVAQKLGIKFEWQQVAFEQMVSSVNTDGPTSASHDGSPLPARGELVHQLPADRSPDLHLARRASEFGDDFSKLCGKSIGASRVTNYPKQSKRLSERVCAARSRSGWSGPGARSTRARS